MALNAGAADAPASDGICSHVNMIGLARIKLKLAYWIAMASPRNDWLRLSDEALLRQCREEHYKASGPGGQRRNKVLTANKLHHPLSGVTAQSHDSRSLQENRIRAVHRLRERIAIEVRTPFDLAAPQLPSELIAQRGARQTLSINRKNRAYPIVLATALDALAAAGGSYARAATALGITTSQLLRFLKDDPEVVRWLSEEAARSSRLQSAGEARG